jgi:hypothetical protein
MSIHEHVSTLETTAMDQNSHTYILTISNTPSLHSLVFVARYTDAELPKFIIMIDDDTWVNVSNMREIVGKLNPEVRNIVRNLAKFNLLMGYPKRLATQNIPIAPGFHTID